MSATCHFKHASACSQNEHTHTPPHWVGEWDSVKGEVDALQQREGVHQRLLARANDPVITVALSSHLISAGSHKKLQLNRWKKLEIRPIKNRFKRAAAFLLQKFLFWFHYIANRLLAWGFSSNMAPLIRLVWRWNTFHAHFKADGYQTTEKRTESQQSCIPFDQNVHNFPTI